MVGRILVGWVSSSFFSFSFSSSPQTWLQQGCSLRRIRRMAASVPMAYRIAQETATNPAFSHIPQSAVNIYGTAHHKTEVETK
ncbi:unnamed protein product [Citrullus colocynthis]|uniref:Secreted protein n=1 Tax=Citrullus colocynthis TaxID=252529 RepID=A0ABP0Y8Y5_9ROSI